MSCPQLHLRSRPGLLVKVVGFLGERLLAARAAAAELDGVDLVRLPAGDDFYDGNLDWCGDELDFLTYTALDSDAWSSNMW